MWYYYIINYILVRGQNCINIFLKFVTRIPLCNSLYNRQVCWPKQSNNVYPRDVSPKTLVFVAPHFKEHSHISHFHFKEK